jgi:hypothetical protein
MDTQVKNLAKRLTQAEKDIESLSLILQALCQVLVIDQKLTTKQIQEWPVWATLK